MKIKSILIGALLLVVGFVSKAEPTVPFVQNVATSYNYSFEPRQYFAPAINTLTYTNGSDLNSITWTLRLKTTTTVAEDYYFDVQYYGYTGAHYGPYTIDCYVAAGRFLGGSQTFGESIVSNSFSWVLDLVYP